MAAGLLAFSHAHIHFSRIASVAYIQGTWLTPLELYFFWSGLERRSALRLALGGLILGLHFNIYLGAQIEVGFLLVYLAAAFWLCRPLIQQAGRRVGVFWLGALIVAFPMLVYAWRAPTEFMDRLNTDGMFQSHWLANTMAETGQSAPQILAGRVLHAFLSLNHYPVTDFYNAPIPLLGFITSTLFVLGLGYALWRTRDPRYLLLNGYFWGTTVAVGVFAIPPSADSYRMLAALPAAVLYAAVGLEQVFHLFSFHVPERRAFRVSLLAFVLIAVGVSNLRVYFFDFAHRCRYGSDPQTRFASYLGNYLRTLDPELKAFLLSDEVYRHGTHESATFLSRNFPVVNFAEPVASLNAPLGTVIIASPNRSQELQAWMDEHPGGRVERQMDCDNLMLLSYRSP